MALPKIGIPYYTLKLISGRTIQYRPFTVKEEKVLLMANESKDKKSLSNAMRTTLNACILQEGDNRILVEDLPMFDVELLFLNIRMKSVGEMSDFNVVCEECEGSPNVKTSLDLRNVRIENKESGESETIMLTDSVGIEIEYPPFRSFMDKGELSGDNPLLALEMIEDCIISIFDDKEVYNRKDFKQREIKEFVDSLTQEHLKKINLFFERMPKLVYDLKVECPCGKTLEKKLQGISDFFS